MVSPWPRVALHQHVCVILFATARLLTVEFRKARGISGMAAFGAQREDE